jgi:hypothetical protein
VCVRLFVCLVVCDPETSTAGRPRPEWDYCAKVGGRGKKVRVKSNGSVKLNRVRFMGGELNTVLFIMFSMITNI